METPMMKRKKLEWKLHFAMANKKIKSIAELKRRLETVGIDITSTQLGRMHYERPSRLNLELLEGLATVLDCEISDIMDFTGESDVDPTDKTKEKAPVPKEKKPKEKPEVRKDDLFTERQKQVSAPSDMTKPAPLITDPPKPAEEDKFSGLRSVLGPRVTAIPITRKK